MGFYGNITNTSKTQFQFDRTYPNRATMEANLTIDGIYAGRYVLIEYDTDLSKTLDIFMRVYMKEGVAYTAADFSDVSKLKKKDIGLGDIVFTSNDYIAGLPLVPTDCIFWKCTSNLDENSNEPATFARVVSSESNYVMNFNIDTAKYGESRGYDSTVWQKVYVNNIEKYVLIAELNSVVPTFDISADAPTIHPILPHFDINSTNVYYKLHWQPLWGFRAKEAKLGNKTTSNDKNNYPSDEKIKYDILNYDSDTGTTSSSSVEYDAAIYYNKLGFDKTVRTKVSGEDHIQVLPTGVSGTSYNTHSLTEEPSNNTQADIQEFLILLPSLGNTISDIWDLIYGYGKKVLPDETYDPSIPSSNQNRFKNIEWKDAKDDSTEGMTRDLGTLAGCINKVHDLMGMIITNKSDSELNEEGFNNNYIYRDNDNKYYRIHKYPTYTTFTVGELNLPKRNLFNSDLEYNTAYEIAILDKLNDNLYYLIINSSSSNKQVEILNKKSLSALNDTDIIGYLSGYEYEYVLIPDMPGKMTTIYGLILKIKNLLEVEDFETRDTSTVIGSINTLNDIIDVFEDLVPGEFLICDSNGHVNSANWTTAQDYSYTNYNSNNPSAISKTFNTKENRWISLSLDEENRNIELKHVFNKIDDTTTTADKNDASTGDGINKSTDDTLKLYTPIVDAMGHIVGKNVETVTLPYSFKKITTNGEVNSVVNDMMPAAGTSVADNTQDEFSINVGNKWLHAAMDENTDTLTLAHEVNAITTTTKTATDLNNGTDTITIQDTVYDAAGHVTANQNHTYTLPYGFKTITTAIQSTANNNPEVNENSINANNTLDTLNIATANKWIRTSGNDENNTLYIGHEVHSIDYDTSKNTTSLSNENSKEVSFTVPTDIYDEAGHLISRHNETYKMPFGYGIIVGNANDTTTEASATYDTLKLDTDKWLTTTVSKDTVTFSHNYPGKKDNTSSIFDMNKVDNTTDLKNKIVLETLTHDEAGHIINVNLQTVTLPYGYKIFKDSNTNEGTSTASNTQDTFVFKGDSWILPIVTEDKVTFTHIGPISTTYTAKQNITPNFGDTFAIEDWHFDDKGHKHNLTTHTVLIPKGSLSAAAPNESDVVLLIKFTPENGAIETQRANIATLKLASYNKETDSTDIAATDTLGQALSKLLTQITAEKTRINNLDFDKSAAAGSYISSIKQIDGQVSFGTTPLPSVIDSNEEGKYVSSVSETNGKISVTKTTLPTYSLKTGTTNGTVSFNGTNISVYGLGSAAYTNKEIYAPSNILDTTFTYGNESKTITLLFEIVNNLATLINTLSQELDTLKNKVETEHPTSTDETIGT